MFEITIHVNISCPDLVQVAAALTKCFGHRAPAPVEQPAAATAVKAAAAPAPAPAPTAPAVPTPPTAPSFSAPPASPAVMPAPAPVSMPAAPAPAIEAFAQATPPKVPLAAAPEYTLDQLARAGASLMSLGPDKAQAAQALLQQFGIATVTALPRERYGEFATALRGLGASI